MYSLVELNNLTTFNYCYFPNKYVLSLYICHLLIIYLIIYLSIYLWNGPSRLPNTASLFSRREI